jgi:hypothetical protein
MLGLFINNVLGGNIMKSILILLYSVFFIFIGSNSYLSLAEDDIQTLERKLEYLKAKEKLDIEFKIIKAKINELNEKYADVISDSGNKSATSDSSSSSTVASEPETNSETKAEPEVETSSTSVPDNQEWEYYDLSVSSCMGWKPYEIKINSDGSFYFKGINKRNNNWTAIYTGNLIESIGEAETPNREKMKRFNAVQEGNDWAINFRMQWPGGGCKIKFKLRVKQ